MLCCYVLQGDSNFNVSEWNLTAWHKLLSGTFKWCCYYAVSSFTCLACQSNHVKQSWIVHIRVLSLWAVFSTRMRFCVQANSWLSTLFFRLLRKIHLRCLWLYVYMSLGQYLHVALVGDTVLWLIVDEELPRVDQGTTYWRCTNMRKTLLTVTVLLILVASPGKCPTC